MGVEFGICDMTKFFNKFIKDESGASAAEYALLLVIIGLAIVGGAVALANSIGGAMSKTSTCITNGTSGSC